MLTGDPGITIIDTIIQTNYTNDAYIFYAIYKGLPGTLPFSVNYCITIIDTIIQTNYSNDAYIFDTKAYPGPCPFRSTTTPEVDCVTCITIIDTFIHHILTNYTKYILTTLNTN
jgi:hypothetical protein